MRERVIDVLIFTAKVSTFGLRKSGVTSQLSRCGVCPLTSSQGVFALHLVVVLEWFKSATIEWRAFSVALSFGRWVIVPSRRQSAAEQRNIFMVSPDLNC